MACQKCLDQRRALLGAVGLRSLQAKVPPSFRDMVYNSMIDVLPVKVFPINIGVHGRLSVKHTFDLAFPSNKVAVDVHYQSMSPEQREARKRDIQRIGWLVLEFPPSMHAGNLESVVSEIRQYL